VPSNSLKKKYWSFKWAETPALGLGDPSEKRICLWEFYKTLFSCSDPQVPLLGITQKAAMAQIVSWWLWIDTMAPTFVLCSWGVWPAGLQKEVDSQKI